MEEEFKSYTELYQWRKNQIQTVSNDHFELNHFHDVLIEKTIKIAMKKVQGERGNPPAPFALFLMGSAGRFEQSVWSDQDHGIIFNGDESCLDYFLALGAEIRDGMVETGYELCEGRVMSSNPLWCKSIKAWKEQITSWLNEESWESLRHFSTFIDSRVLIGETHFLDEAKQEAFTFLENNPHLYHRLIENVEFVQKGIGIFGQLLPERQGEHSGSLKLKQKVFFPYVNAARLLALKENMLVPSTLSRLQNLPDHYREVKQYEADFQRLLDFRLHSRKEAKSYKEVHLIPLRTLSKSEKKELKWLMKRGYSFFSKTKSIVEKEGSAWT